MHSAGVGGALDGEIGELPVDILDRGSDGSETEPAEQSGPIAIDNSDNSDDVDVENIDGSDSLLAWSDDKGQSSNSQGPSREVDTKTTTGIDPIEAGSDSASDICLLATVLNDLKDISAPRHDPPLNFEARYSPDTRKKRFQDPCGASRARSNQSTWLAEMRNFVGDLPTKQHSNNVRDKNQERNVSREDVDVPPLLKKASPVRSHNRNTPPPLKHKDAGSPRLSPAGLRSSHASVDIDPVVHNLLDLNPNAAVDSLLSPEFPKDHQAIPPISTLKKPLLSALTSSTSSSNNASSCHFAHIDSHLADPSQVRGLITGIHSTSHKSPIDLDSSSGSGDAPRSADCSPHLDVMSPLHSSTLHSSHDCTKETPSCGVVGSSPVNLHPVNPLSRIDFHSAETDRSKEKQARTDSTSGGCRNETVNLNSCQVELVDLHPSSSVSAGSAPAGSGVFSGVNSNDTSPAVLFPPFDSSTQYPSHSSGKREHLSQRLTFNSVPTTAPSDRSSPIDLHPRSHKSTSDLVSYGAASEGLTDANESTAKHKDRLPHGHQPPTNLHSSRIVNAVIDGLSNHTALPLSSTLHTPHRKCSSRAETTADFHSDSKHHNHIDADPRFPIDIDTKSTHNSATDSQCEATKPPVDAHSKRSQRDFRLHADNHTTPFPESKENQWNSTDARSDSQSPIDERSTSSVLATRTHSAT